MEFLNLVFADSLSTQRMKNIYIFEILEPDVQPLLLLSWRMACDNARVFLKKGRNCSQSLLFRSTSADSGSTKINSFIYNKFSITLVLPLTLNVSPDQFLCNVKVSRVLMRPRCVLQ